MASRTTSSGSEPKPRPGSLRLTALRLLARRDFAIAELRTRLLDRGYDASSINDLLNDFIANGALDDRRFAAAFVRRAIAGKGRGRYRIARELEHRGVPRPIVEDALAGVADDEAQALRRILMRKRWPAEPSIAERRRMFQHLLRRGFSSDAIKRALASSGSEVDNDMDP